MKNKEKKNQTKGKKIETHWKMNEKWQNWRKTQNCKIGQNWIWQNVENERNWIMISNEKR